LHSTDQHCAAAAWLLQLPLLSAYATMHDAHGAADSRLQKQKQRVDQRFHEPLFSNLTKDFKGTLDYILYTNNFLQVGSQPHCCTASFPCVHVALCTTLHGLSVQ
jgi:hypothetical protein